MAIGFPARAGSMDEIPATVFFLKKVQTLKATRRQIGNSVS
jgi:hypothetical protein